MPRAASLHPNHHLRSPVPARTTSLISRRGNGTTWTMRSRSSAMTKKADNPYPPRLLTREQAAYYCGVSMRRFGDLVSQGIVPKRLARTKLWDKEAIDAALDIRSGIKREHAKEEGESALTRWLKENGSTKAEPARKSVRELVLVTEKPKRRRRRSRTTSRRKYRIDEYLEGFELPPGINAIRKKIGRAHV